MQKVALYARFSTDKQSETSVEDQFRLCEFAVSRNGWEVVAKFSDEAKKGSVPLDVREGSAKLLNAANKGDFDVIVVESLDRLSRDAIESQTFLRNMQFKNIRVMALSDGYDSENPSSMLLGAVRSAMGEMYLVDLACKTHRGMAGQVERGFAAGNAPYGYKNVKVSGGSEVEIVPEEAAIVNRIFTEYANGKSPHNIVADLNRDRVISSRGSDWHVSAVVGNEKKGCGILHNSLYNGVHIWNRSQWIKHPETKKRVRRERPESEWMIEDRPDLRIVPKDLWQRSRERLEKSRRKDGSKGRGGKSTTLFGGLISCGKCGGSVISINGHSYGCSNRRDKGAEVCDGVNISKKKAEEKLLPAIENILGSPEVVDYVYREAADSLKTLQSQQNKNQDSIDRRLTDLNSSIERLIDAISQMGSSESLLKRLESAEAEKVMLQKQAKVVATSSKLVSRDEIQEIFEEKLVSVKDVLVSNIDVAKNTLSGVLGDIVLKKSGLELLPR